MGHYVIINAKKKPALIEPGDATIHQTHYAGHAVDLIHSICDSDPIAEIHVYGGDGSVFEAVNAIMTSGHASTASIVIHPFGTGNDFARNFKSVEEGKDLTIDLIRFNDHYAANEVNLGFDCDVVALSHKIKKIPLCKGGFAYMISAILTLFRKMGRDFEISFTDIDGSMTTMQSNLLLCLISNGAFYGGGFHCAPRASLTDGYLELILVKKISRLSFLKFFLGYRKGEHILPDGTIPPKYAKILKYHRVTSVKIKNAGRVCADGELFDCEDLCINVVKGAFRISVISRAAK